MQENKQEQNIKHKDAQNRTSPMYMLVCNVMVEYQPTDICDHRAMEVVTMLIYTLHFFMRIRFLFSMYL